MDDRYLLITENTFHSIYLVDLWLRVHGSEPSFGGVALRTGPVDTDVLEARRGLHRELAGRGQLDAEDWQWLHALYPDLSATERAMIGLWGVPARTAFCHPNTWCVGTRINSASTRDWLTAQRHEGPLRLYVFLDRILAPWWIDLAASEIVNAHSAVLPHARGMYAIEQVAAAGDVERFQLAAGATTHYVDTGVDTGAIIRSERLREPLSYGSIWECKARQLMLAFDMLTGLAADVAARPWAVPVGVKPACVPSDTDFKAAEFTPERRAQAELGYQRMKAALQAKGSVSSSHPESYRRAFAVPSDRG